MIISKKHVQDFLNRSLNSFYWIKRAAERDILDEIRELAKPVGFKFLTKPYKHQAECFYIGACEESFLFFADMGLGKTKVTLDLYRYFRKAGRVSRGIITCPSDTSADGWVAESKVHCTDYVLRAATGSSEEKWKVMRDATADLVVVSYPGLVAMSCKMGKSRGKNKMSPDTEKIKELCTLFDFVGLDEIHRCKNHNSLTFKVCDFLCDTADIRFGLTGTPMNAPEDFWAQFYLIDRGETLGETLGIFRAAYFNQVHSMWAYNGIDYEFDRRKQKRFTKTIRHKSIRYEQDECLDLPKTVFTKVPVTLTQEARAYYAPQRQKLVESMKARNRDAMGLEKSFVVLREVCSGFVMWSDEDAEKKQRQVLRFQQNPKLDSLLELVEEIPATSKVVIFHEFVESGRMIGEALAKAKIKAAEVRAEVKARRDNVTKFLNDPECRVLVINTAAGGESLNLQVANYMIFYETPISPIMRKQCLARIRRAGQNAGTVFYYDLVAKGTVEEQILGALEEGANLFDQIVNGKATLQ